MINLPGGSYPTAGITHLEAHLQGMRRKGRADKTIKHRRRIIVLLAEHLGHDPATATRDELEAWQSAVLDAPPAPWGDPAAEVKRLAYMRWTTLMARPYYRDMHQRGLIASDPCALLELPPAPRRAPRPAAQQDVDLLLDSDPPPRIRSWLLLGLLGLRCIEIARLHGGPGGDFHPRDGVVYVRVHGKGRSEREIGIPSWMWPELAADAARPGPCWLGRDGVQVSENLVSKATSEYMHSLGLRITLHWLRHKAATDLLRVTGNLRLVQALLGHVNLSSVQIYTEVTPAEVAEALERVPMPAPMRLGWVKAA